MVIAINIPIYRISTLNRNLKIKNTPLNSLSCQVRNS